MNSYFTWSIFILDYIELKRIEHKFFPFENFCSFPFDHLSLTCMILVEYYSAFCNWHHSMYHGTFNIEKITNQHLIHVLIDSLKMNQMDDRINSLNFAKVNFCSIKSSNNKLIKVFFILNTTHRALCWIFHELISNILTFLHYFAKSMFCLWILFDYEESPLENSKTIPKQTTTLWLRNACFRRVFWNDFRFELDFFMTIHFWMAQWHLRNEIWSMMDIVFYLKNGIKTDRFMVWSLIVKGFDDVHPTTSSFPEFDDVSSYIHTSFSLLEKLLSTT